MKFGKKIPVTLVGGFLGAGKTTLLNHLISLDEARYGVVVNEFGEAGVDAALIENLEDGEVEELAGGCLCCVGREDLTVALHGLISNEPPPGRILVELSGLADPVPVAQQLLTTAWRGLLELDSIVAVADARNLRRTMRDNPEGKAQLAYASVVLLNKADLVDEETLREAEQMIGRLNPLAAIVPTSHSEVSPREVIGLHAYEPGWKPRGHRLTHGADVGSITLRSARPLRLGPWISFHQSLLISRPDTVYRAKGVLQFEEIDYPMVLQAVRELYSFEAYDGEHEGGSALVVIGRDLDEAEYREAFRRVIAPDNGEPPDLSP